MNSQEYWEKRAAQEMYELMKSPEAVAKALMRLYMLAANGLLDGIDSIFDRFKTITGLSDEEAAELLAKVRTTDMSMLIQELKKDPKNRALVNLYESGAYRHRIEQLAETFKHIDIMCQAIDIAASKQIQGMLEKVADRAYYHEIFEIQRRTGVGYRFRMISQEKLEEIIQRKWKGSYFSSRIWNNTQELAKKTKELLIKRLLTGGTLHEVSQEIQQTFASGSYAARRVARTEANHVANELQLEAYKASQIEKYRFLATLDLRTSKICRSLDNKVFLVKDAKVGTNMPPMHPFCRSTTIAYIPDGWLKSMTRNAIDPKTGKRIKIPANMNYRDWYNKYVKQHAA